MSGHKYLTAFKIITRVCSIAMYIIRWRNKIFVNRSPTSGNIFYCILLKHKRIIPITTYTDDDEINVYIAVSAIQL